MGRRRVLRVLALHLLPHRRPGRLHNRQRNLCHPRPRKNSLFGQELLRLDEYRLLYRKSSLLLPSFRYHLDSDF